MCVCASPEINYAHIRRYGNEYRWKWVAGRCGKWLGSWKCVIGKLGKVKIGFASGEIKQFSTKRRRKTKKHSKQILTVLFESILGRFWVWIWRHFSLFAVFWSLLKHFLTFLSFFVIFRSVFRLFCLTLTHSEAFTTFQLFLVLPWIVFWPYCRSLTYSEAFFIFLAILWPILKHFWSSSCFHSSVESF